MSQGLRLGRGKVEDHVLRSDVPKVNKILIFCARYVTGILLASHDVFKSLGIVFPKLAQGSLAGSRQIKYRRFTRNLAVLKHKIHWNCMKLT